MKPMPIAARIAAVLILASCSEEAKPVYPLVPAADSAEQLIADGPHDVAVFEMEDLGIIRVELLSEIAPNTVKNFIELTERKFYDRTKFHRVVPGFMIQGGDPLSRNKDPRDDGSGGPGYKIDDELNGMPYQRGVLAMTLSGQRHTAGCQFFILHQDQPEMKREYTVFGRVVEGMDVVDAITELEIDVYGRHGKRNRPYPKDARITTLRIERAAGS